MDRGISCPVCGRSDGVEVFYSRCSINRCANCSHVFYFSAAMADEISRYYGPGYFKGREYFDYEAEKKALVKNFRKRLDGLLKLKGSGALLEIGCAYGYFLDLAKYYYSVEGIDVVEECKGHAGVEVDEKVRVGQYLELPERRGRYDVVCMWDVVEHLEDPRGVVEKVFRELKPGGVVALTTGDISSLTARLRKEKWRLVHPPSHVHYFTTASIRRLLEGAGFKDVSIGHPGNYRSLGAMLYNIFGGDAGTKPGRRGILEAIARGLIDVIIYVNFYDSMLVMAAKRL